MTTIDTSRNPYHDGSGRPKLKRSVFVLMDVLGYKEMVLSAEKNGRSQELTEKLYAVLSEGREMLSDGKVIPEKYRKLLPKDRSYLKAFTDNIVIGLPIRDDAEIELGEAFDKVANFQLNMAINGFFVRGAISVGEAFVDEIAVVGDALLKAYNGEVYLARDPRVVITESAVAFVNAHLEYYGRSVHAPQVRDLLKDADGQWFVNYLNEILIAEEEVGPYYELLEKHKAAVEEKLHLTREHPNIFSKYVWVASYHNYFCDLHRRHSFESYKIDTEIFRAPFRRIVD